MEIKNNLLITLAAVLPLFLQCKQPAAEAGTVRICGKVWADKNLEVDHYQNGDPIPRVDDAAAWDTLTTGAYCYYGHDSAANSKYGKLYNWYAMADRRGLVAAGWHVATYTEWDEMIQCLGGYSAAGGKLKSRETWQAPNAEATDSTHFSALAGGRVFVGSFRDLGKEGYWWTSNTIGDKEAYYFTLSSQAGTALPSIGLRVSGYSIRLVKD